MRFSWTQSRVLCLAAGLDCMAVGIAAAGPLVAPPMYGGEVAVLFSPTSGHRDEVVHLGGTGAVADVADPAIPFEDADPGGFPFRGEGLRPIRHV